jgi:hypothetical protein
MLPRQFQPSTAPFVFAAHLKKKRQILDLSPWMMVMAFAGYPLVIVTVCYGK